MEIRYRAQSLSRARDKYYFSPSGTKFTSMVRVQEYCKLLGIPLPSEKEAAAAVKVLTKNPHPRCIWFVG